MNKILPILISSCPIFLMGSVATVQQACAHSLGACTDHVVQACNNQWPDNYNARIACVNSGITACQSHSHGGGGGVEPASEDFAIEDNEVNSKPAPERIQRPYPRERVKPNNR